MAPCIVLAAATLAGCGHVPNVTAPDRAVRDQFGRIGLSVTSADTLSIGPMPEKSTVTDNINDALDLQGKTIDAEGAAVALAIAPIAAVGIIVYSNLVGQTREEAAENARKLRAGGPMGSGRSMFALRYDG